MSAMRNENKTFNLSCLRRKQKKKIFDDNLVKVMLKNHSQPHLLMCIHRKRSKLLM